MNIVEIRQATRNDAPAIHELHTGSVTGLCKGYYSDKQIHAWIGNRTLEGYFDPIDRKTYFVATIDSKIVGFEEAVPGEVCALFVSPDHAHQGIGTLLLEHAMKTAAQAEEITLESTLNAVGFYEKHGFQETGRKSLRRGNEDIPVVLMKYCSVTRS